ncbi:hypothetical protein TRFO_08960 [Tritrichomonas foetus]|uniref:Uncharacterized protein n=1 Tax=Tritrichomonas foetus TaxID=1144522 RepID=A0A1J4JLD8_9EUKA|nr:hypothetical protein TRFO_08960 [Tritrichomonas foetus]|eukprot:OHS98365.1 hypothetical protein TRFO_08960 [Tritrichomonas foetus]
MRRSFLSELVSPEGLADSLLTVEFQDMLLNLEPVSLEETIDKIANSTLIHLKDGIERFVGLLHLAVKIRSSKIVLYVSLIKQLKKFKGFEKLGQHLLFPISKDDCFNRYRLSFLYNLLIQNAFAPEEVLPLVKNFILSNRIEPFAQTLLFFWFSPFLYKLEPELFKRIETEIAPSLDPQFDELLSIFDQLSSNDFEGMKKVLEIGHISNSVEAIIKKDDIDTFQKIVELPHYVSRSNFECSEFLRREISLLEFSAFCGSIHCFTYLINSPEYQKKLNTNDKTSLKQQYSIVDAAVAGANSEIIKICDEYGCVFTKSSLQNAIQFHHFHIFHWILHEKITKTDSQHESQNQTKNPTSNRHSNDISINDHKQNSNLVSNQVSNHVSQIDKQYLFSFAAKVNNIHILYFCIEQGLDVNGMDRNNAAPIHYAAMSNDIEALKFLLSVKNIDVNIKNGSNQTPLLIAASNGNVNAFKLLLKQPTIDVNAKGGKDQTPPLLEAVKYVEMLREILKCPEIEINAKDIIQETALHKAALFNNIDSMKILLENPDVDVNCHDAYGVSKFSLIIHLYIMQQIMSMLK